MPSDTPVMKNSDVPAEIFTQFLGKLETEKLPPEVVARLRQALLEDRTFTEFALRKAVLGEEEPA